MGKNEEPPDAKYEFQISHVAVLLHDFHRFDHQWSFARAFHVSPFNDRLGTYAVSVRAPFPHSDSDVILPLIRVRLHTPAGLLKFSASLRATYAAPFRTHTVLAALLTHPFILFLTLPRILCQATVLHYRRRLDVYKRPEPKPVSWSTAPSITTTTIAAPALIKGGGIGWQHPTLLERAARRTVNTFLARRADVLGVCITLQPGNPSAKIQRFFGTHHDDGVARELVISYLSPRFFTLLVLAGDARTALRRGDGSRGKRAGDVREFMVSDEALFCEVFDARAAGGRNGTRSVRLLGLLPLPRDGNDHWDGPHRHQHPLVPESRMGKAGFTMLLCALVAIEWAEELLWRVARVRWALADPGPPR